MSKQIEGLHMDSEKLNTALASRRCMQLNGGLLGRRAAVVACAGSLTKRWLFLRHELRLLVVV